VQRLSIVDTIFGTLAHLIEKRAALSQALVIPAVLLAVLDLTDARLDAGGWPLSLAYTVASVLVYCVFAVSCHRIILLGSSSLPNPWGCYFTWRELRYLGWSLLIPLMAIAILLPSIVALVALHAVLPESISQFKLSGGLVILLGVMLVYAMARALLVFPAVAIDQRPTMSRVWRLSAGNGWRLTFALIIPGICLSGIEMLLEFGFGRADNLFWSALFALGACALGAIELALLSVVFRILGGVQRQPTAA
jgi:hypothetical protein